MIKTAGYATPAADQKLAPFSFERREPEAEDVQIDILFCGVCHSDVHQARNEWHNTRYPCLPGHEIIGRVIKTGTQAKKYKAGDLVGVGCMVDSCQDCDACREGLEQYCEKGLVLTYNGAMDPNSKENTFGGYSGTIVVKESFVVKVPETLDPAGAAPLLCAGITTYSPLRHWKVKKGDKVGVVGLGGLGHMGIKLAHAMGAHVTLFTTSPDKEKDAKSLGADVVVISKDKKAMEQAAGTLDYVLNTIPTGHDIDPYINLLKRDGMMTLVGCVEPTKGEPNIGALIMKRRSISGSLIGGIKETQEMLDFCGEHGITSDIEIISIDQINESFDRVVKGDVKYRFVIDMASLKQAA